jgi:type II secretory pathway component GspD/PulD (secretin)
VQREVQELLELLDRQPQLIAVDVTVTELRTPSQWALDFGFLVPLAAGNDAGELIATLVSSSGTGSLLGRPTEGSTVFGRVTRSSEVPFLVDDGSGTRVPIDYNATFEGVDRKARTDVLIQPSLVVTSGEDQEIFVGNNYPVPVTEPDAEGISELGALVSRTTTFERRDVGIRMGIEATSGVEGKIRLNLDLEISALVPSLAGPIEKVGPSFLEERLTVTASLEDGETALLAIDRERQDVDVIRGTPFLSSIPFIGFLFTGKAKTSEDTRLIIAARTRRMSSPSELVADTIRRRLAFERANERDVTMPSSRTDPYAVRVTTRSRLDDAEAIGEGLALAGHETEIHRWTDVRGDSRYDVYVVALESMADAAEIARDLAEDGWETDVVVLPTRS